MCTHHHLCGPDAVQSHDHDYEHQHRAPEQKGKNTAGGSSPCDHSPQCDQGDCTFVVSKPQVGNLIDGGVFSYLATPFNFVVEPTITDNRIDRLLPITRLSSGQRCALQQSWQI